MNEVETIEGEVVEELERHLPAVQQQAVNLFGEQNPAAVIGKASEVATALAQVVDSKELFTIINGRKHVRVEGWTLLGSMLGVFPVVEWSRELPNGAGWEARVTAQTRSGEIVGAAEGECRRDERTWKSRDSYALRSMAQTRAVSKALRHPLGFIMTLAGYEETPEAEMPRDDGGTRGPTSAGSHQQGGTGTTPPARRIRVPRSWAATEELVVEAFGRSVWKDFAVFGQQAKHYAGEDIFRATVKAAVRLVEQYGREFPPPTREEMQSAWHWALELDDGVDLAGPEWRMSPDEEDRPLHEDDEGKED